VALYAIGATPPASAQQDPLLESIDEAREWYLYANPELGVYGHTGKGNTTGSELTGPRVGNPSSLSDLGTAVTDPERSRERILSMLIGGTVGALSPAIDVAGRPRLFMDVNVAAALTTEVQLARRGNPGPFSLPPSVGGIATPIGEGVVRGTGTQIGVQQQGPQLHAGFGTSVEFPLADDDLLRFKVGVTYSRTRTDLYAQTRRAVRLNNDAGANQSLDDFRFIELEEKRTEIYHAAGPTAEIEYLPRLGWGPTQLSLFAKLNAAHIFTDPKTKMQQCNTAGGQPEECVFWKYTQDVWTYRAVAGVRLQWAPGSAR